MINDTKESNDIFTSRRKICDDVPDKVLKAYDTLIAYVKGKW